MIDAAPLFSVTVAKAVAPSKSWAVPPGVPAIAGATLTVTVTGAPKAMLVEELEIVVIVVA